jgi:hypothetical protein
MRFLKKQNTNQSALNGKGIRYGADEVSQIDSGNALIIPKGTTAERPGAVGAVAAQEGMIRYNTSENYFEVYELNTTYFTPGWKRFRTDEPRIITSQSLGNGDDVEHLFGPLNSGDSSQIEPYALNPAQVVAYVENVPQLPVTNYYFIQNPCRINSNKIGFYADYSVVAGVTYTGISVIRSWDAAYVDWADLGFYVDQIIVISGSASNNGIYQVLSVTATALAVTTLLVNEFNAGFTTTMTVNGYINQTVYDGTATQVSSTGNLITLNSTSGLTTGAEIVFDTAIGNILANKRYYIKSIASPNITVTSIERGTASATISSLAGVNPGRITVNSSTGLTTGMEIVFTGAYAFNAGSVSAVNSGGNITIDSTSGLVVGMRIIFAGNSLGNIVPGTTYYIKTITPSTTITISTSLGGGTFNPGTATGTMNFTASGSTMGNILPDVTYYIYDVPTATTIRISGSSGGPLFDPGTDTGYVVWTATQSSAIDPGTAGPTSVNWLSGRTYSNTTNANSYVYFGTPVPAGKPVTIIHGYDR